MSGIAPLGSCGRALSALSRLSRALTSLAANVRGNFISVIRSLLERHLTLARPDHEVAQVGGADHFGQPLTFLGDE